MGHHIENRQTSVARVVAFDESQQTLDSVGLALRDADIRFTPCRSGEEAFAAISAGGIDLVIAGEDRAGIAGIPFLETALEIDPWIDVMLLTEHASIGDALFSLRLGAACCIEKPVDPQQVLERVQEIVGAHRRRVSSTTEAFRRLSSTIVGRSPVLLDLFPLIEMLAERATPVLVHGESGVGKELIARAIHDAGPRRDGPYIVCNCSALSASVFESEFFGHARGAFTDADDARPGLFEAAHGGVLFLDEIGDLALESQGKLLRVLESGEVQRVGETSSGYFDVQVVAATNKDLRAEIDAGNFRSDLYYRLNVAELAVPPLRERRDDIPALVEKFLVDAAADYRKPKPGIEPAAIAALRDYRWPGNVRELRNVVQRAMLFHEEGDLTREELVGLVDLGEIDGASSESIDSVRREHIRRVLAGLAGNKSKAAEVLGVSRVTLFREMKRYGLQ
jgi:DNA-binding NtrC family response regulator